MINEGMAALPQPERVKAVTLVGKAAAKDARDEQLTAKPGKKVHPVACPLAYRYLLRSAPTWM
jgi:hypothetical protein